MTFNDALRALTRARYIEWSASGNLKVLEGAHQILRTGKEHLRVVTLRFQVVVGGERLTSGFNVWPVDTYLGFPAPQHLAALAHATSSHSCLS